MSAKVPESYGKRNFLGAAPASSVNYFCYKYHLASSLSKKKSLKLNKVWFKNLTKFCELEKIGGIRVPNKNWEKIFKLGRFGEFNNFRAKNRFDRFARVICLKRKLLCLLECFGMVYAGKR